MAYTVRAPGRGSQGGASQSSNSEEEATLMDFRVANVICRFNSASGGPPRTILSVGEAARGYWRTELFTTDFVEGPGDKLLVSSFEGHVNVMPSSAQGVIGGALRAAGFFRHYESQLLKGVSPQVIHLHGLWSPLLAAFARTAVQYRIPYIVAPHGMLEPWSLSAHSRRKKIALQTYQGWMLRNATAIHATSEPEAQNLRALKYIRAPVFIIPNAVDRPLEVPHRSIGANDKKILLFLSRIHEKKGLENLLRAWKAMPTEEWELRIVGSGATEYVEKLRRLIAGENIQRVMLGPHVDGMQREIAFRSASAFVLPTFSENFGNVVAEALVRGIPVITTTGTPWSEIRQMKLGWYVEPTVEALRRALGELFSTDAESLREMGERGRQYSSERFLSGAIRTRLLQMYRSAIGAGDSNSTVSSIDADIIPVADGIAEIHPPASL